MMAMQFKRRLSNSQSPSPPPQQQPPSAAPPEPAAESRRVPLHQSKSMAALLRRSPTTALIFERALQGRVRSTALLVGGLPALVPVGGGGEGEATVEGGGDTKGEGDTKGDKEEVPEAAADEGRQGGQGETAHGEHAHRPRQSDAAMLGPRRQKSNARRAQRDSRRARRRQREVTPLEEGGGDGEGETADESVGVQLTNLPPLGQRVRRKPTSSLHHSHQHVPKPPGHVELAITRSMPSLSRGYIPAPRAASKGDLWALTGRRGWAPAADPTGDPPGEGLGGGEEAARAGSGDDLSVLQRLPRVRTPLEFQTRGIVLARVRPVQLRSQAHGRRGGEGFGVGAGLTASDASVASSLGNVVRNLRRSVQSRGVHVASVLEGRA
jgi:hypothetical protein